MLRAKKETMSSIITEQKLAGDIWDMHAHLTCLTNEKYKEIDFEAKKKLAYEELNYRRSQNIAAFFSCGMPEEWSFMQKIRRDFAESAQRLAAAELLCKAGNWNKKREAESGIRLSFGIHPWYSDQYDPEEYRAYFEDCDAVGEIGMDSVWCEVHLERQRKVFQRQIQMAADFGKPVILHTKGQEREIVEMIRDFPGKICVHWYSGEVQFLEAYLQKDCYFTLGPDFSWKKEEGLYQYMLQNIPDDRLFLETDGLDAVIWAYEEAGHSCDLPGKAASDENKAAEQYVLLKHIMNTNLEVLSAYKKKKPKEMLFQLQQNLFGFLSM